ncbi:MAG: hypothetical protein JW810_00760 [Sedimentisphaerales bacterium]|nr:hypothetical protein [Sedimentisphaerales bacterium]
MGDEKNRSGTRPGKFPPATNCPLRQAILAQAQRPAEASKVIEDRVDLKVPGRPNDFSLDLAGQSTIGPRRLLHLFLELALDIKDKAARGPVKGASGFAVKGGC